MAIEIRKAERVKSKLRLGIAGPAGSGKTMSALKVANGMGGPVCLIDTERGKQLQSLMHRVDAALGRSVPRIGLSATLGEIGLAAEFLRERAAARAARDWARSDALRDDLSALGIEVTDRAGGIQEWRIREG